MVTQATLEMERVLRDTLSDSIMAEKSSSATNIPSSPKSDRGLPSVNPLKRTRKAHQKVRTGCATCKIRRKKCDETKPACVRCTSTGRKCDGYAPQCSTEQKPVVMRSENALTCPRSTTSDPLPSAWSCIETQCHQSKRTRSTVTEATPTPTMLLPKEVPMSIGETPANSILEIKELSTSPAGSSIFTDSAYGTLEEYDKSEEEELEDFILSYRKPILSTRTEFSAQPPIEQSSTVPVSTSPKGVVRYQHPPPSGIAFERSSVSRSLFPYGGAVSEIERHCFTYFRYRTGPSFSSYFDSSIWCTYAVSAALAHPVVLSCAAACGAAHRRWGFGISREAFEYCAHADRLHKKAIRGLEDLKREVENSSSMGVYDRDVIMTSEMLLGMFQGFQGEYQKTVIHMNNGIKHMLGRPMTLVHSESRYCAIANKPNVFCEILNQLNQRAFQLFKTETTLLVKWGQGNPLPPIPKVFKDLEDARDLIFTEVDWIMNAPARVWQDKEQRSDIQDLHVRRLLNWSVAYANTIQSLERNSQEKKACYVLKVVRNAAYMLLYLTSFVTEEVMTLPNIPEFEFDLDLQHESEQKGCLAFASRKLWETVEGREEVNTNLERVKLLIEDILDDNGTFNYDEHSVSFDSAIGPPKRAGAEKIAVPEASEKTRHLVKRLMQKKPDDCSLWDMLGVYGVAERISAVEEHAVIDAVRSLIPDSVDPKWVDITCLMESRRVLLRYCRPDDYGLGMMWTQEWWTF